MNDKNKIQCIQDLMNYYNEEKNNKYKIENVNKISTQLINNSRTTGIPTTFIFFYSKHKNESYFIYNLLASYFGKDLSEQKDVLSKFLTLFNSVMYKEIIYALSIIKNLSAIYKKEVKNEKNN